MAILQWSLLTPTGHWVLALSAISQWGYRPAQFKPVPPSAKATAALIRKGDLVVSRSNTRELVGLPMIFPDDRRDVSYPDTMMRIPVDSQEISAEVSRALPSHAEMQKTNPKLCRRNKLKYAEDKWGQHPKSRGSIHCD